MTKIIPKEVLFGEPDKASPQISPNGKIVSYLAPHNDVLNIWIKTIGKNDDKPITDERGRGIRWYFWCEDNTHIIYLKDSDGDENWHLYGIDLNTGIIRDYTPFKGIQSLPLATNPNFPTEMLIAMNIRDRRLHDAYRLNLKTGAIEEDTLNPGDVSMMLGGWLEDPSFKIKGCVAMKKDGSRELRVKRNGEWETIAVWGLQDHFSHPIGFTPDGKGIYICDSRDSDTLQLFEIDILTGKKKLLAYEENYDVWGFEHIIHPKTYKLQAVCFYKDKKEWKVIDKEIEKDVEIISNFHRGALFFFNRDIEDSKWLIGYQVDNGPIEYYVYDRKEKSFSFLFYNKDEIKKYELAEMKPIRIKARDGLTLQGYLTLPIGLEPKNLPLVLLVHGGPWERDVWRYHPVVQLLANRGYAVLQINFRGSIGFGKRFLNAGSKEWGGKMQDDLIDGINWTIKEGIANPKKIAIMGASYGGYAALCGAAFTPDVFCCAISICGVSNLITFLKSIPPYWETERSLFNQRIGNPETEEEFLKSCSPLFKVDNIKIPLLIAQGANDVRIKKEESEQIVNALKKREIPVEYLLFPDEGHMILNPKNRLKLYERVEKFLAQYLGGRVEAQI